MRKTTEDDVMFFDQLRRKLETFVALFDRHRLATKAAELSEGNYEKHEFSAYLDTYMNEAVVGLRLISPYLVDRPRILEIGSGVGILSWFLSVEGYDVTGIEPGSDGGFGFMTAMSQAVAQQLNHENALQVLPIGAEALDPIVHGEFDLIFSVNVMEHVMELESAFSSMSRVLAPRAHMVHLCPNYNFPYEPHLGIPIVPGAPQLTRYVLPTRISRNQNIWSTLNFITASHVGRLAHRNGLQMRLEPGVMAQFFDRLRHDPVFKSRHSGLLVTVASSQLLGALVSRVLRAIPVRFATPMIFILSRGAGMTNSKNMRANDSSGVVR